MVGGKPGEGVVVAHAPHVVDHIGAGGKRGLGHGRLGGVDAERGVGERRAEGRDDRHDTTPFLVEVDGFVARPGRLTADVQDVGALLDHAPAPCDGDLERVGGTRPTSAFALGLGQQAVPGERVGRHVEDPHHERPLAPAERAGADPRGLGKGRAGAAGHLSSGGVGSRSAGSSTRTPRTSPTR